MNTEDVTAEILPGTRRTSAGQAAWRKGQRLVVRLSTSHPEMAGTVFIERCQTSRR